MTEKHQLWTTQFQFLHEVEDESTEHRYTEHNAMEITHEQVHTKKYSKKCSELIQFWRNHRVDGIHVNGGLVK